MTSNPATATPTIPYDSEPSDGDARQLVQGAQTGLLVVQDDVIRFANPAFADMVGWPMAELLGQPHYVTTAPEQRAMAQSSVDRVLGGRSTRPGQMRCLRRDGSSFDARAVTRRVEYGGRPAVLVTVSDTSELSRALRGAEWNAGMLARTEMLCRSGSFEILMPSARLHVSPGLRALAGMPEPAEGDAAECDLDELACIPPDERALVAGIWRNAVPGEPFEFQHRLQVADGGRLIVLHRGVLNEATDAAGEQRGVAILQDITAQREAELRLEEVANHNEVTGLPNRGSFLDQVDAATHAARWSAGAFTLVAIDIPRIAEIKASMGFGAGDALTMSLAARLAGACGSGETVAQLGDTEFVVMLEHAEAPDIEVIRVRALELQATMDAPVRLAATDIYPRCVFGIACFPSDGESAAELLERAQTARLGATGADEGSSVAFFRPESNARVVRAMHLESGLRQAIARNELRLVYQPQVALATGKICGAEALLRWNSPELGAVSPVEFIPIAERSGLIGAIGEWVMRRACEQSAAWRRAGLPPVRVGVNLSPAQLQRPDLARQVQAVLVETGADPACLGIELTESMAMADVPHAAAVLREIKSIGVEISLDDFGTGHSSLSCLRSLPIDVVKVDRSFVHDVTAAPQDVSVTRAIITMAHGLQMQVLVEGVETEGQLALLAANRCDTIQGFWFSPPVPPEAFEAMLREGKHLPDRFVTRVRRTHTLLLVDDEENIIASLKRLLRRDGYHIVTATSAAEGLQRLAENDVDVIVSDQRMPGMSGVEFLRRAKDLYPDTVRIVLSGYTELQSILDAINEGAIYRFLTKPWDDQLLRAHIAEAFRQKDMADENRRLAQQVEDANADLAALNARLEQAVTRQREQAQTMAISAGSMREVLDELPAAVLGIDPDGMVAFVNREAERVLPDAGRLIGRLAREALPPSVCALIGGPAGTRGEVTIAGSEFRVMARALDGSKGANGHLVLLVPHDVDEAVLS